MIVRTRSDVERRGMFARMGGYLKRQPGVRRSIRRAAVVGGIGVTILALRRRNLRLAREAMGQTQALRRHRDLLRSLISQARNRRGVYIAETRRMVRFWHGKGMPEMGKEVIRHRWPRTRKITLEPSPGLIAAQQATRRSIKATHAEALRRAKKAEFRMRHAVGLGAGLTWAAVPAVEDRADYLEWREAVKRHRPVIVVRRRRRLAA